jgi:hypothetical protein
VRLSNCDATGGTPPPFYIFKTLQINSTNCWRGIRETFQQNGYPASETDAQENSGTLRKQNAPPEGSRQDTALSDLLVAAYG